MENTAKMPWFMGTSHKLVPKKYVKANPPPTEHKSQRPQRSVCVGVDTNDTSLTWPTAEGKRARPVRWRATPCWRGESCSVNIPRFYLHPDKSQDKSAAISTGD